MVIYKNAALPCSCIYKAQVNERLCVLDSLSLRHHSNLLSFFKFGGSRKRKRLLGRRFASSSFPKINLDLTCLYSLITVHFLLHGTSLQFVSAPNPEPPTLNFEI